MICTQVLHAAHPALDGAARAAACAADACGRFSETGRALSNVGPGLGAPTAAAAAALVARRRAAGAKTAGSLLAGYFLGVQGFAQVVKAATARVRPDQLHHATYSFPSLHTATAVYMAGALLCVLAPALLAGDDDPSEGPPWRWTPAAAGGVASLGAATAAGRVLTESHWLSDTVAGAALGVAALAAAVALANDADAR